MTRSELREGRKEKIKNNEKQCKSQNISNYKTCKSSKLAF